MVADYTMGVKVSARELLAAIKGTFECAVHTAAIAPGKCELSVCV